jgi:hypothetical protein
MEYVCLSCLFKKPHHIAFSKFSKAPVQKIMQGSGRPRRLQNVIYREEATTKY